MSTALRLAGPLFVLAMLLAALFASYQPREPKPGIHPTKLEKICRIFSQNDPKLMAHVPCHLLDEWQQTQWSI